MAILELQPEPQSPRQAREFTRELLGALGVPSDVVDDAELLVTEAVTNAVIHARTPILLEVEQSDDGAHLRIAVTDYSRIPLLLRRSYPSATTGRGLDLVDQVSSHWSVQEQPDGKVVEMLLDSRPSEHPYAS